MDQKQQKSSRRLNDDMMLSNITLFNFFDSRTSTLNPNLSIITHFARKLRRLQPSIKVHQMTSNRRGERGIIWGGGRSAEQLETVSPTSGVADMVSPTSDENSFVDVGDDLTAPVRAEAVIIAVRHVHHVAAGSGCRRDVIVDVIVVGDGRCRRRTAVSRRCRRNTCTNDVPLESYWST